MSIRIEAVMFNHDPGSLRRDAMNLRLNGTTFARMPEWQRNVTFTPDQSVAAYAILETTGQPISIKARFSSSTPEFQVRVRALDANTPPSNVLGDIPEHLVNFNFGTQSQFVTLTLDNTRLTSATVGSHVVTWRWQARDSASGVWADIGTTSHRIYTVLREPGAPWTQSGFVPGNLQLPWVDALDFACHWARGAETPDEAAERVTLSVHALGGNLLRYDREGGNSNYSFGEFYCEHFLRLLRGQVNHRGRDVNCSDCATIVSTFANLVGCDLAQSVMGGSNFKINLIEPIGFSEWSPHFEHGGFRYHEVAWTGNCTSNDNVYDACLRVDSDANPMAAPHAPHLAINMRFGETGDGDYRDMLARDTADGRPQCGPTGVRTFRKIRDPRAPDPQPVNFLLFASLAADFRFEEWRGSNALSDNLLVWNFQLLDRMLLDWNLTEMLDATHREGTVRSVETLWTSPPRGDDSLLSIDVYECATREAAHDQLFKLLGQISIPALPPLEGVGDVAFAVPAQTMILFARANLAVSIRDASPESQSVSDIARHLDKIITERPEELDGSDPPPPDTLTATTIGVEHPADKGVSLLPETQPTAPASYYKFFSHSGEFRIVAGRPQYLPGNNAEQEVTVVGIGRDGKIVGGDLRFKR